jgi:hypothetical protein
MEPLLISTFCDRSQEQLYGLLLVLEVPSTCSGHTYGAAQLREMGTRQTLVEPEIAVLFGGTTPRQVQPLSPGFGRVGYTAGGWDNESNW